MQYVLIAAFGGYFMLNPSALVPSLRLGNIHSMLQYSKKFTRPVNEIANQYASILTALAGAERIFEIMDSTDEVDEGRSEITVEDIQGNIRFEDIHFAYEAGEPVLKGLDLWLKKGQKIAIVGATGSGKTTVVNLLTRFYEIDGGRISIDGVDITEIPKDTLRRSIAIVLQDTVLFSDTIRANIKYGRTEASDEEMRAAAALARADEFIERLPEGYDTPLGEDGGRLSQGQKQLLCIARVMLCLPPMLILDEATSSIDLRTEIKINKAFAELMEGRTSFIVAHRLNTIKNADCILVMRDGKIVEQGRHDELIAKNGFYAELYGAQFKHVGA
jgi:ATP-binding cassette subfamily B protein